MLLILPDENVINGTKVHDHYHVKNNTAIEEQSQLRFPRLSKGLSYWK